MKSAELVDTTGFAGFSPNLTQSSILRTIPVAFMLNKPSCKFCVRQGLLSAFVGFLCYNDSIYLSENVEERVELLQI